MTEFRRDQLVSYEKPCIFTDNDPIATSAGARRTRHKILRTPVQILHKTELGVQTYRRKGDTMSAADALEGDRISTILST